MLKIISAFLIALVCFNPITAKIKGDFFKPGFGIFRPSVAPELSTVSVNNDIALNLGSTNRKGAQGLLTLSFKNLLDKIQVGAEFDLNNYYNIAEADGVVSVFFSSGRLVHKKNGALKGITIFMDDETVISGKIKIKKINGDKFTFVLTAVADNAIKSISNPLSHPSIIASSSRVSVPLKARITTSLNP